MEFLLSSAPKLTRQQEIDLISQYQDGDTEAGGTVVHSRMPYILSVIRQQKLPSWVDIESIFTDVCSDVAIALRNFDPTLSNPGTYIYRIVSVQSRKLAFAQQHESLEHPNLIEEDEVGDPTEVIERVKSIFERLPASEMNETSWMALDLLFRGNKPAEIGRIMGWPTAFAKARVEALQREIAWRMVMAGESASPWISDSELQKLAKEHDGGWSF